MSTDIHTHAFHPKIAHKVLAQLEGYYKISPVGTGLAEDLVDRVHRAGLKRAVVHTAATSPGQVVPANNWSLFLQKNYPELEPFGTLHPGYADWEKELERLSRAGIRGLKLHPDFQGFRLDDPSLAPIFEAAQGRFMIMFHVGDRFPPARNPSCPRKIAAIHHNFPELTIIAAHFGGLMHWEHVVESLAGLDVFLDTSSSLEFIPDHLLRAIMSRHSRERILFGSDYPLYDPGTEIRHLRRRCLLTDRDMDTILFNGDRLIGPPRLREAM